MKEPVFMDKLGFCQQLSMKSAVFMDKQTDGVFEATCHPRLGVVSASVKSPVGFCSEQPAAAGVSKEAGVAGTHRLSVCYIEICKELFCSRDQKVFYIRPVHCAVDAYELHLT